MFNHTITAIRITSALMLSMLVVTGCANTASATKPSSMAANSVMKASQHAQTLNRAMVGTTKDYFNQMEKLSSQGYADELQLMANNQDIYILPAGVHVEVLDTKGDSVHIKLLDAPWQGREGYTEADMIQPSPQ